MSGFGFGIGPNGQFGPMYMVTSPEPQGPQSYEGYFETPEGITIAVRYCTDNKVFADRYQAELATQTGWRVLDNQSVAQEPSGLLANLAYGWLGALALGFMVPMLALMGAAILDSADFTYHWGDWMFDHGARIGVYVFVFTGLVDTVVSFIAALMRRFSK